MTVFLWFVLTILMTQKEPSSKQTKRNMDLVQLPDAGCLRATKRKEAWTWYSCLMPVVFGQQNARQRIPAPDMPLWQQFFRSTRTEKAPFLSFKDRRLSLELNFPTVGILFTNLVTLNMYVATTAFREKTGENWTSLSPERSWQSSEANNRNKRNASKVLLVCGFTVVRVLIRKEKKENAFVWGISFLWYCGQSSRRISERFSWHLLLPPRSLKLIRISFPTKKKISRSDLLSRR